MAGDDLAGLDELATEQAGDHRLGHDAGADGRDRGRGQGGHRAEYSRGTGWPSANPPLGRVGDQLAAGQEEAPGRRDPGLGETRPAKRGLELGRLVVDLDDRELAAVVEAPDRGVVGRRRVVDGARLRVGQRIDEGERAARPQPAADDAEELVEPGPRHVAQPEAGEHGVDGAVGLGPGVADVEMGAQAVGDEPLAGPVERRRRAVVHRQLALGGEERRPPAGPRGELDDLAARSAARRASDRPASSSAFQAASWIGPRA